MTLSQKDLNSLIAHKAFLVSLKTSDDFYRIVCNHGEKFELEMNSGSVELISFFGEYYA